MGVGFVALHGIMDSCSFALATSLALSLYFSVCFPVEREMGGKARWLDCLVRSRKVWRF